MKREKRQTKKERRQNEPVPESNLFTVNMHGIDVPVPYVASWSSEMPDVRVAPDPVIGGKPALVAVVDQFYTRILADKKLAPLFAKTDMKRQRSHQVAFLAYALGGPSEYRGQPMQAAHAGRGITAEHFGLVAGHLQATLQWAKVGAPEVASIMTAAASLQGDIVGA